MPSLPHLLLLPLAGAIGSAFRYLFGTWVQTLSRSIDFPYGMLAVNLLGGFTTFSSFANDSVNLVREGDPLNALANVGGQCYIGSYPGLAGSDEHILDLEMNMQLPHAGTLLLIFIGEADKVQGKPLYAARWVSSQTPAGSIPSESRLFLKICQLW